MSDTEPDLTHPGLDRAAVSDEFLPGPPRDGIEPELDADDVPYVLMYLEDLSRGLAES